MKKAEHRRIDAFELWYWRRPLRAPWTARKSNQSILNKINPEYSLEGLMLKLKPQYFCHLMQTADSLEKTWREERFKAGGEEGNRGWDDWMASPIQWTWTWANSEKGRDKEAWCAAVHGVANSWAGLSIWIKTVCACVSLSFWKENLLLVFDCQKDPQLKGKKRLNNRVNFERNNYPEIGEWQSRFGQFYC